MAGQLATSYQLPATSLQPPKTMIKKWVKQHSQFVSDQRIFKVRHDTSVSPRTGLTHTFVVLESPEWCNIIPVTPEGKVIMIRQYRHGNERVMLEVPGGLVDAEDDSPQTAAHREMLEETGYDAVKVVHLGTVSPNPAFLNNECHSYLALGVHKVSEPVFDGAEDIVVEEVALTAVPDLIHTGEIAHSLTIAAFYHFDYYRQRHPDWNKLD